MNKKNIIQIAVIVVAFSISGIVLYKGFGGSKSTAIDPSLAVTGLGTVESTGFNAEDVLPYGKSLDFDKVLKRNNLEFGKVSYPKLDPDLEVGKQEQDLIKTEE
jgi:hypothetical protein